MTPVVLIRPFTVPSFSLWPLLRRLAGRQGNGAALPDDMEDWQLRDLALTRTYPGPCRTLTPWLP